MVLCVVVVHSFSLLGNMLLYECATVYLCILVEHVAGFQDLAIAHKAVVDIWSVSPDVYMHLCL